MTLVSVLSPRAQPIAPATASGRLLTVAQARARRLALAMRRIWESGQSSPDQGLAITPEEVARLLVGGQDAASVLGHDPEALALTHEVEAAEAALLADDRWSRLIEAFALDPAEADLLLTAVAVEIDPGLQRVYAYLHDDVRAIAPTGVLAARLAGREPVPVTGGALHRWRLAEPLDDASPHRLATAWRADPAVVLTVCGQDWRDPAIEAAVTVIAPQKAAGLECFHGDALAALEAGQPSETELVGPAGVGRQTLAAQFAAARGRALLAADLPALLGLGLPVREALLRVLRQARAMGALAYFRDADAATPADWTLAQRLEVPFLRGAREGAGGLVSIAVKPLDTAQRLALWNSRSASPPPRTLVSQRLTPAQIIRLAEGAPPAAQARPDHSLLTRLPRPYAWDDLVLPADVERQLRAFEDQVRLRWTVYEDWGFSRLAHLGSGVAALFGGPSGTGKTMAAQVIARSLDLELYRVDLAGVVNKYVGETEKKLREVFDACEHAGALLFFDEADALFGARMQAKDAHDRFANIEINYLLQRIESFDGVAILATNRRGDVDQAFVRRLRFVVDFLSPRPQERLALWRKALLPQAPGGEAILGDIDWSYLAERLPMSGAEIKNTALAAAFLAKAQGTLIGMAHLTLAAERELAKQGNHLRVPGREAVR
ncbi:MAG TPA: ATP-binding protein [Caulobacteraceae bacterium]